MMHHIAFVAFLETLPEKDVVAWMRHSHRHKKTHFLQMKERMLAQARS